MWDAIKKWFLGKKDARKSVAESLSLFSKLIKKIQASIEICSTEIEERSIDIDTAVCEKAEVMKSLQQAKKALLKLEEFID